MAETERRSGMSEYQEEVLTNLLDLQAELRGDEPEPHAPASRQATRETSPDADRLDPAETIAVTEQGVTVSAAPASVTGQGVNDRLAALNQRLGQLEYDLAGVTKRIEKIEPDARADTAGQDPVDVEDRWRSFLDLQKIVADRLDHR
jgi:uncharacterized coiled-coil protein SlyX